MASKEKRKAARVPIQVTVDCQFDGNFLYESATDISQHGIFIETTEPLPVSTEVNLNFSLPDSDEKIEVAGSVMWINECKEGSNNPGMGVRFTKIRDIDKETITSLVRRLAVL